MSAGNRGLRSEALATTAFCAAALVGSIILFYSLGVLNGREAERREQTPESYSKGARFDAERSCSGREPGALFDCIYERVEASGEQANAEQDLSAQQRAATSGLASAVVAFLTLIVTGIGVWFVKRTLDATLTAVEDTSLATKAMGEQNRIAFLAVAEAKQANLIAKEAASLSSRPWLGLEETLWNIKHNSIIDGIPCERSISFWVTLKNSGASAAVMTGGSCYWHFASGSETCPSFPDTTHSLKQVLPPGKTVAYREVAAGGEITERIIRGEMSLYYYVNIEYVSTIDSEKVFNTKICIKYDVNGVQINPDGERMPNMEMWPIPGMNVLT